MFQMNKFEKVSLKQFYEDCVASGMDEEFDNDEAFMDFVKKTWQNIKLPKRATTGSAGYDFYMPVGAIIDNAPIRIPTGIRCKIDPGYVLLIVPRSGLGFKYGEQLMNTIGVIDSDYYNAKNEGHIMASVCSKTAFSMDAQERFMQGIFVKLGYAEEEEVTTTRAGGIGSTGNA